MRIDSARRYVEPIDVLNGEYVGFDAAGRCLSLAFTKDEGVRIGPVSPRETKPEYLAQILSTYLVACGVSESWLEAASLAELVTKSLEFRTR